MCLDWRLGADGNANDQYRGNSVENCLSLSGQWALPRPWGAINDWNGDANDAR